MVSTIAVSQSNVQQLLENLLGRDVIVADADAVTTHPVTLRGLVDNDDQLVSVIGCDLSFAHRSGAALAMLPAGKVEDAGDEPDEMLIEVYTEVANVLSRVVNEAHTSRVRLDPNLDHGEEVLQAVVDARPSMITSTVTVDGYGVGQFGIWQA